MSDLNEIMQTVLTTAIQQESNWDREERRKGKKVVLPRPKVNLDKVRRMARELYELHFVYYHLGLISRMERLLYFLVDDDARERCFSWVIDDEEKGQIIVDEETDDALIACTDDDLIYDAQLSLDHWFNRYFWPNHPEAWWQDATDEEIMELVRELGYCPNIVPGTNLQPSLF